MPYSAQIVSRARRRLESARADREAEAREHLRIAYARQPRLKEIDMQLRLSMAEAVRAAFSENGKDAMAQARATNQALQEERRRIVETCFEPGFLNDSPVCDRCGGSGYIGTQMCACLRALCRQEQAKEIAVLASEQERFQNFRLDYYPDQMDGNYSASPRRIMEKNLDICKKYAQGFRGDSGNLLFIGGTGLGKTFLSACIARVVAENGFSVTYETAPRLFAKLEKDHFDGDEESRESVKRMGDCDLLIIDDLGTELPGNFVTAALYSLINERLLAGKPMVISTNLNIDELTARYSPQIGSRLQGSFRRLTFVGKDIRVEKNRGVLV